mgnify:CR=1 FL=1
MLKGKIDCDGRLHIERAGKMKMQRCKDPLSACRDTCPLFGEPRTIHDDVHLTICMDRDLTFSDFIDERE